ncbi:hypothetical protein [Bosea sp. (in: a-proteobacteria)]|uniref:hypothetical protein n=1 Tax=Bosea sp. (in: a-proteobacteria) TaxID=1871050 RepID=UPI0011F69CF6|nr:hypothetical protein [Bosea sp. (in: a-proteobacteria)]TAJ28850.1 MAG: hypothetical protein EPO59_16830 [Bosea sp. (in: a-proteobacteria)]
MARFSDTRRWTRFTLTMVAAALFVCAAFLAAAYLLDPYDTGRSPLALKEGVRPQGPRTAAASRGRDPAFDSAIFGNSHVQLLSPERLDAATGLRFVSLIAPATRPKEVLTIMDWFLRHRRQAPKVMVVGIDWGWCTADPALPNDKPFPFWLFSRSTAEYLVGLMRYDLLEEMLRRVGYILSENPARGRPDGYWNYEQGYRDQGYGRDPALLAKLQQHAETGGGNLEGPFPAALALESLMKRAPAETVLLLLRTPVYATGLPKPGTANAKADAACRSAFEGLATRRPHTVLVDWKKDRPELHDPDLFFDHTHYRQPVAKLIEADIAAAIGTVR